MNEPLTLPNAFTPRAYQVPLLRAFIDEGKTRGISIWHRRGGKDRCGLALTSVMAMKRPGTYWHMLPTNVQARRVVWDAVARSGTRLIDEVFPPEFTITRNEAEMSIDLVGGSRWWCVGSDNYDRLVGTDPVGCVFSEYALGHPSAWEYIRPILAENGGWALFLSTPRGRNHLYSLWNQTSSDPAWFRELMTVEDTGVISQEAIEFERRSGMAEEMIQQEFYCSFSAGTVGNFYNDQLKRAREEGRITTVPHNPALPVETWWDLGLDDATAVWFVQWRGAQPCAIAYKEWRNTSLIRIAEELRKTPYRFGRIVWPHDGGVREQTTARTRQEVFEEAIGQRIDIEPRADIAEGVNAARLLLDVMAFDARNCEQGLYALESYGREWDEEKKVYSTRPRHDWASHGADALRTGAMANSDVSPIYGEADRTDPYPHLDPLNRSRSGFTRAFNRLHPTKKAASLPDRLRGDSRGNSRGTVLRGPWER